MTHAPGKRAIAPMFWLLFGAGGMLAALFGPALIILTGIMAPHGWVCRRASRLRPRPCFAATRLASW